MSNIFKDNFRAMLLSPSGGGKSFLLQSLMTNPKYNMIKSEKNKDGHFDPD